MSIVDKIVEKLPDIYEDGLKEAVQESGKTIALVPKTINAALSPLRQWIARHEYNVKETEKLLAQKLENVGIENIVSPDPYVAVPAFQAISYSMNSEELRNLYANLLTASMINDIKWKVHPSFVEIIKQLSPDEAKMLNVFKINESDSYPLIDVVIEDFDGYRVVLNDFTNIFDSTCEYPEHTTYYLDNLERLKIIKISNVNECLTEEELYIPLETSVKIQKLISQDLPEGNRWEIKRKYFQLTQYGKNFIEICVIND